MSGDIVSLYRARLAREKGTVKKDWGGRVSVALAYPNSYHLGMSNLGFQIVYGLFNQDPHVVCERIFLPEGQELSLYLRSGKALLSLESQRPLHDFDLVAFSLSFENDYPNILRILDQGKVPLLAEERRDPSPLVMAGGVTTFLNPEPVASFMDFFLLGEAEVSLPRFLARFREIGGGKAERNEILTLLAREVPGLYVPLLYEPGYSDDGTLSRFTPRDPHIPERIEAAHVAETGSADHPVPASVMSTPDSEFGEKILVELGRGCGRACRFCAAGYVYRPPRVHGEPELTRAVSEALSSCDQVGLLSPAVSDVPGVDDLTGRIVEQGGRFSVSSLRADSLSPALLDHLKAAGQRTVAIAPEAGSERLRRVINKHLSRDQIMGAVRLMARTGPFSIRLYFLLGLPTETQEDVAAILDLVKGIKHHMVKESAPRGTMGQIRLSVNCFVPKPFTPFQWVPLEPITSLREKQKWLRKSLSKEGGVKMGVDVPRWAYVQALLSLGDRRVGSILLSAHRLKGNWSQALRSSAVNPDFFVYRTKDVDERLPWDFIDHGILKAHLAHEYGLALKGRESDVCRVGECVRCGVCLPAQG